MIRSFKKLLSANYGIMVYRSFCISSPVVHDTYIAIGSNVGDRVEAFRDALTQLRLIGDVTRTSFLYQTPPMYVTDQEKFLNAACHLRTSLNPDQLLVALKSIEQLIGRKHSFRNGPRLIDIDIIMHGNTTMLTENLQIPHLRLHERAFVLRPLCDMDPTLVHPTMNCTVLDLLNALPESDRSSMQRVVPIGRCSKGKSLLVDFGTRTYVCGVLNVTPDSFSDGGQFEAVSSAVTHAMGMIEGGADMIDIGGESTRPGSVPVTLEEEIRRVVPVIRALRTAGATCLISVDTRNAQVAREAISAGADLINDVSGGRHDPLMFSAVAELGVPIVMMHMRGTPQTMTHKEFTTYPTGDCIQEIASELNQQLSLADTFMPRWMQIVDPGIGFAKGEKENLSILKHSNMKRLRHLLGDRPVLFGSSRKRFLGAILKRCKENRVGDVDAATVVSDQSTPSLEELDWATASTSSSAVTGGADIIRVHNVRMTRAVCDITRAIVDQ